jgi:DNA-binding transcriptional LysR family regulator
MLDLRRLAILRQFDVSGSIAATAESLGYSPSAISQQLTTLERETGAVLIERTARSARLTDAGRLLARHARTLLAESERAESDLAAQRGLISGSVVVTTIPSLAAPVATAVVAIQQDHPAVEIVMRQSAAHGVAAAVADNDVDIAVTDDWSSRPGRAPEGLTRRSVGTEAVVLAVFASHPLAKADRPLTPRELANAVSDMTWLCSPDGHPSRVAGDRRLDDVGATPRSRWEFEGLATVAELVASGIGCALLPESVASTQAGNGLHTLRLSPAMTRRISLLTRTSTTTSPTVAVCVAAIRERLRAVADSAHSADPS